MKYGVVFPQTEIGNDPAVIRDYAQTAEGLGYSHLIAYDHVLGAGLEHRPDWRGPYNSATPFHEVFVLFGYLAAVTSKLRFVTGVLVLPQRQTALVAKQAAEIDVLSGGRLWLGVGIGWNEVEFDALGENFHNRGRRIEEQITVLRRLWTEPVVDFEGRWHRIPEAGLNPMPIQRPIPIWMGGTADVVLERTARLADGWMPQIKPDERGRDAVEKLRAFAVAAGREPESVGIEARLSLGRVPRDEWGDFVQGWKDLGAEYMGFNTMGIGLATPRAHIDMIAELKNEFGF